MVVYEHKCAVADIGFHFPLAQNFWPIGQKIPPPPAGPPLSTGPKPFPPARAPLAPLNPPLQVRAWSV